MRYDIYKEILRVISPGKNKFYSVVIFLLAGLLFINPMCKTPLKELTRFPYKIRKPDHKYVLEQKLAEVSGLSFISDNEVALIQDEIGSLFIYNLEKNAITKKITFSKKGDFEDLKILGDSAFILRSDGSLFELKNIFQSGASITENPVNTPLSAKNNTEGLCYDDRKKLLLIACKGDAGLKNSGKKYKDKKAVYSFNPETGLLSDTPYVLIDVNEVEKLARGTYKNVIEKFVRFYARSGLVGVFEPSGIAIHPFTRDIYLISSVGKVLVIVTPEGKLAKVVRLSPTIFKQPEGIAFDQSGNLFISNEGRDGHGNILKFIAEKDTTWIIPGI
jgi:hypothetical protein